MATMEQGILYLAEEVEAMAKACRLARRRRPRPGGRGKQAVIDLRWLVGFVEGPTQSNLLPADEQPRGPGTSSGIQ